VIVIIFIVAADVAVVVEKEQNKCLIGLYGAVFGTIAPIYSFEVSD